MPDGSMGNPLIRLYEFTDTEASLLLANVSELAQGSKISITLNDLDFITPMNDCTLLFILGDEDQGISDSEGLYMCVLTQQGWKRVAQLIDPFTDPDNTKKSQCLDETGEVGFLLSPSGNW